MRSTRDFVPVAALPSIKTKPLFRIVPRRRKSSRRIWKRINARRTRGWTIKRMRRKKHCRRAIKAARRMLHTLCLRKPVRRLRRQSNALSVPRQFARKPLNAATAMRSLTRRGDKRARPPFIETDTFQFRYIRSRKFGIRQSPGCLVFSFPE